MSYHDLEVMGLNPSLVELVVHIVRLSIRLTKSYKAQYCKDSVMRQMDGEADMYIHTPAPHPPPKNLPQNKMKSFEKGHQQKLLHPISQ